MSKSHYGYYTYIVTVQHDYGVIKLQTVATNKTAARAIICACENCSQHAIINVKKVGGK